ncbi:hypothetical protein ABH973_003809 [Bradyrhizobium ottawaense]
MGQILHGCATTTEAVRRAIQNSQESLRGLAKRYGINQKTVAKWKQRETVTDRSTGPKEAKSTVLSIEEEAIIVAFRQHTLLPLDDCLYALQPTIPHLTRSSLHRCLQRHGISRLPEVGGGKPSKKKFKAYPIGYFHIDIAELRTAKGKLHLYVAIDRTSKFAFVQLARKAGGAALLFNLVGLPLRLFWENYFRSIGVLCFIVGLIAGAFLSSELRRRLGTRGMIISGGVLLLLVLVFYALSLIQWIRSSPREGTPYLADNFGKRFSTAS